MQFCSPVHDHFLCDKPVTHIVIVDDKMDNRLFAQLH